MTIQDYGSIGEIVGAIATVATLLYLAVQIRTNTRAVRASTHHSNSQGWSELNAALGADIEASRILLEGGRAYTDLQADERFRFTLLMRAILQRHEDEFFQIQEGLIAPHQLKKQLLASALSEPGVREWWMRNCEHFSSSFQEHVGAMLAAQQAVELDGE